MIKELLTWLPIAINVSWCGFLSYQIIRSHYVRLWREEMVRKIFTFLDPEWRLAEFDKVGNEKMVFSFKRLKVENYYKSTKFLEPTEGNVLSPFQPQPRQQ